MRTAALLRGTPGLVPRGVYRFKTFDEAEAWMNQTIARTHAHLNPPPSSASAGTLMEDHDDTRSMKVLGRRRPSGGGLVAAAPFLDLVIRLRSGRPFIPKGIHRFRSFEESAAWSMQMMTGRSNPGHLA
jgi:hypothetical protein